MADDHIKIGDISPRIQYVTNGVQTAFPFPFPIFKTGDLKVHLNAVRLSAGYTVSGAGQSGGGAVSFAVAPAADQVLTLARELPLQRTTDFQTAGAFRAAVINDELDTVVAALQQIAEELSRAPVLESYTRVPLPLRLSEPIAGAALQWSADGTEIIAGRTVEEVAASLADEIVGYVADLRGEVTQAVAWANKAKGWAQEDEDIPMLPGQFSAYHYSEKARAYASGSSQELDVHGLRLIGTSLYWIHAEADFNAPAMDTWALFPVSATFIVRPDGHLEVMF